MEKEGNKNVSQSIGNIFYELQQADLLIEQIGDEHTLKYSQHSGGWLSIICC